MSVIFQTKRYIYPIKNVLATACV